MNITDEQKQYVLEHSTTRHIAKEFPEYQQFFTSEVETIQAKIENAIGDQRIDVELKFKKSFFGNALTFSFKRQTYDIEYLLSNLKRALNHISFNWYSS